MSLPHTTKADLAPLQTQRPRFFEKTISQSKPYPGAKNTLTVTLSSNTNIHTGSVIAIHRITEAIAAEGNIRLNGTHSTRFKSLTGAVGFGTWNDCDKVVFVTPVSDLGCDASNFTFTFEVWNPVEPQLCAEVLLNVTLLNNPTVFSAIAGQPNKVSMTKSNADEFGTVYGGYDMEVDTWSTPADIHGAGSGDSCPMTIWPAAFLIKNIGQSNQYPGGLNTITVSLATNVPMYSTINYPARTAITTKIIITRITGALQDGLGADGSKSITLGSTQGSTVIHSQRYYNNTAYFTDGSGNSNKGKWQRGATASPNEPSLAVYPNPSVASCCVPEGTNEFFVKFTFDVYNPCGTQSPIHSVSIMAQGIPIIESGMREDIAPRKPMHILKPTLTTKEMKQSDASPGVLNTITVSLQSNVNLYARCKPVIVLSDIEGIKESMFSNLTAKYWTWVQNSTVSNQTVSAFHRHEIGLAAVGADNAGPGPSNLNSVGEWSNQSMDLSSLMINVTAPTVLKTVMLSFQFRVRNGCVRYGPPKVPEAVITGIGMQPSDMTRSVEPKSWPITVAEVRFLKATMKQSTPFPAAVNTLTVNLKLDEDLTADASCGVRIVISGLAGACVTASDQILNLGGSDRAKFSAAAGSNVHSKAKWDPDTDSVTLFLSPVGGGLVENTEYVFTFDVRNPSAGQESPAISIEAFGIPIPKQAIVKNPANLPPPDVFGGTEIEADPLYVRGLVSASGFLKKIIAQSSADPGATNVITMTLQMNVPLTQSSPASAITVSGLRGASASHGTMPLTRVTQATSGTFDGTWNDVDKTLVLVVTQDTKAGKDYKITFTVTNDMKAQTSPVIMIQASGIVIQATKMETAAGTLSTRNDEGVLVDTAEGAKAPLLILAPKLIKRYAKQTGDAWPAQDNALELSFTPTVELKPVAGATVSVMITGLKGVNRNSGVVALGGSHADKFTDCVKHDSTLCTASRATWNSVSKKLTMNLYSTITALTDVTVTFAFNNSKQGQDSPTLKIELVTDIDQQAVKGLHLTEYNRSAPASSLAATVASADTAFQGFTEMTTKKVVGLLPSTNLTNDRRYLTKNQQLGAKYEGYVVVQQAGDYLFGNTGDDYVDIAIDGKIVSWRATSGTDIKLMNAVEPSSDSTVQPTPVFLTKGKHHFRARMIQGTGSLGLNAYWKRVVAGSTDAFTLIPNEFFEVKAESLQLSPESFGVQTAIKNTDQVPLLIYRSAKFTTKNVGQSSSKGTTPGATNTIAVTIRPQFALTGAKQSTITISGLIGSLTPDATLALLDSDALFNSTAKWNAKKGSLILSVAPGQTVPSTSDTVVKFDLSNPTVPQSGAALVQISADGDVPISASAMVLGAGNSVPLKVLAATFSQASIGQSSKAPFADNTITVTVQPSVILSRGRRSTLTIHGLTGSDTESTRAMPIAISDGSVPPFTSPFSDLKLSFGPGCELANNKVLILDTSDTNYTGTELYSTQGTCKGNKTVITSYNVSTRCATLQSSLCSGMGAVQSVQVIDGGSGYKSGPISIAPGTAGSGLSGNCTVDDMGSVTSITLFDGGNGYPDGAEIFCPSACDTASCGVKSSSGAGAVAKVTVTPDLAAVVAASWDRLTGRLEMRVRGEINTTEPIVMSFVVKNGKTPQASRDVYVMAGGSSPVGSTKMTGTAMSISGLDTTVTSLCACTPSAGASTCTCTTTMSGIPTGRDVYALKAEYQCNTGASLVVKVNSNAITVAQPPTTCKDSCQSYHTLVSWYNVAAQVNAVNDGTLPLAVDASNVAADYCGAGNNLKVVFTLIY
jgi:hypothetical protein